MKDSSNATERVGRYQLLEPIGGGPNGAVARAKVFGVAGFERQFAVKRFLPDLTVGPLAQALSAAARSYGSLEHPRIARMSEFGVTQGQTFTAVEYVAGLDAFRLLTEAKLAGVAIAAGGALALVSQAARAVGYAHGRGLSHLGLSPTNVIVTADGDVKVTDFGILAATMPPRPVESARLASRIPYLSPEQLAGEATSAASDVFTLGVIAYELVTGQRAFRGDSPAVVAQAILAGPPAEPPLPRPIVRVLQRCLARSPFERFPDARALADALDAALRVAPVPGTRKDVGAQVKTTLERYAQLNEGNVSGMVALNLHGAPQTDPHDIGDGATTLGGVTVLGTGGRPEARTEPSPMPTVGGRPEARTEPSPMPVMPAIGRTPTPQSASSTLRDIPKPFTTMPGLAPPIPVPPGVSPPPSATPILPGATNTMPGLTPPKKPGMPAVVPAIGPPKRPTPTPPPSPKNTPVPGKAGSLTMGWDAMPDPDAAPERPSSNDAAPLGAPPAGPSALGALGDPVFTPSDDDGLSNQHKTVLGLAAPAPGGVGAPRPRQDSVHNFDSTTGEMSASQIESLNRKATLGTAEIRRLERPATDVGLEEQSVALHEANSVVTVQGNSAELAETVAQFAADAKQVTDDIAQETAEPAAPAYEPAPQPSAPHRSAPHPSAPYQPRDVAPYHPSGEHAPAAAPRAASPASPVPNVSATHVTHPVQPSSRVPLIAGLVLGIGVLGAGGYIAYDQLIAKKHDKATVVASGGSGSAGTNGSGSAGLAGSASQNGSAGSHATGSAGVAATGSDSAASAGSASQTGSQTDSTGSDATGSAGSAAPGSAGSAAGSAESGSAGSAAGSDAGSAAVAVGPDGASGTAPESLQPTAPSDDLRVSSKPRGARVFIDGADQGTTPVKLPGSADHHTMAVLLPGHDLFIAEVDGQGVYEVALKPITPRGGFAGIKVIKCKAKERYYVYVDGEPTGMTCPTERIDTVIGPHTVEVYDLVTETRRKFDIVVKDDRLSVRVRIDN